MNDHASIQDDLALFATGDLPPERQTDIEAHLAHCPQCTRRLADIQQTLIALRRVTEVDLPEEELADFFDNRVHPLLRGMRMRLSSPTARAAALLLAFLGGALADRLVRNPPNDRDQAPIAVARTPRPARADRSAALGDGSRPAWAAVAPDRSRSSFACGLLGLSAIWNESDAPALLPE